MKNILLKYTVILFLLVQLGTGTILSLIAIVDFDFDKIELMNVIELEIEEIKEINENVDEKIQQFDTDSWFSISLISTNLFHLIDFQSLNYLEIISPPPE